MSVSTLEQSEFGARVEPYRRELRVHCYRMMGSIQDAEDMVQEAFLRAWRRRDIIEEVTSLRAWLYKVATNICLDALKSRPRRRVPATHAAASALSEPIPTDLREPIWLEPYPDALLPIAEDGNPEALMLAREQITLAFIVALHRLPPRQRAVLLLRDVLDWPAGEVASFLDTTIPAVKSALHRGRALLAEERGAAEGEDAWRLEGAGQSRLDAYVAAWESADGDAFARLLKDDATFSMPPIPAWYQGRETIRALVARTVFGGEDAFGRWRLRPTRANGQPALVVYRQREDSGDYDAYGIQVITFAGEAISDVITFRDPALPGRFGFPATITAATP